MAIDDLYYAVGAPAKQYEPPKTEGAYFAVYEYLWKLLRQAGLPERLLHYAAAQVMHETNNWTSELARKYNNFSGIKYVKQKDALNRAPVPGGYAMYSRPIDWARDYVRVLGLQPGRPIAATTAQQFLDGMRRNKYFEDPAYYGKFNAHLRRVIDISGKAQKLGKQFASGKMKTYTTGDKLDPAAVALRNANFTGKQKANKVMRWISDHPLAAAGIGVGVVFVISRASHR